AAGPDVVGQVERVDAGVGLGLLVGDQGAVVVLPAGLPEDLVAAEEGQVHAGVAGGLDVGALLAGPVLVVADREEGLVVAQLAAGEHWRGGQGVGLAEPVGVDAADVAEVVAVGLEPADHRVLGVEQERLGLAVAGDEGAVVADLVGAAGWQVLGDVLVEGVAAVVVVGLPGGVGGLDEDVGVAGVVADDEEDVVDAGGAVGAAQAGEVDAGDGGAG